MKRATVYLVKVTTASGPRYIAHIDRNRRATELSPWRDDARPFSYSVALAVARRNNGRLKIIQP